MSPPLLSATALPSSGDHPHLQLALGPPHLSALSNDQPVPFELPDGRRAELRCDTGPATRGVDLTLRVTPHALGGLSVGARVTPVFDTDVGLSLSLVATDANTHGPVGPVQLSPGVSYERVVLPGPAPSGHAPAPQAPPIAWKDRLVFLGIALAFLLPAAWLLEDYPQSGMGLGILGLVSLYGAVFGR